MTYLQTPEFRSCLYTRSLGQSSSRFRNRWFLFCETLCFGASHSRAKDERRNAWPWCTEFVLSVAIGVDESWDIYSRDIRYNGFSGIESPPPEGSWQNRSQFSWAILRGWQSDRRDAQPVVNVIVIKGSQGEETSGWWATSHEARTCSGKNKNTLRNLYIATMIDEVVFLSCQLSRGMEHP